jgi:hypothetical protein
VSAEQGADDDWIEFRVRRMQQSVKTCLQEAAIVVDGTKKCPKQPPLLWFPPLVLSTSAYSVSVHRPPTSCSVAWDNLNNTTSVNSLSNFHS